MMTSFQLHKERKKEKAFSEKDKAGYRGQRCRCVCIRGVGLLLTFLHLVQIELQMHLLCILDIQQPLPINHFVSSYILSSVFHLTCQGPFTARFNSNTFLPLPLPQTTIIQVTVTIRVLFKVFVTIEVFVDKVHLWAWFVLHY